MKPVFFNNLPIYLVTDLKHESEINFFHIKDVNLNAIINKMEKNLIKQVYIYNKDMKRLWHYFSSQFKVIEAGGGKVFSDKDEILFIYRNDKWDLPKGKIEKGESVEDAAVREVKEETGIENLKIICPLETTYHIYKHNEKYVLKISYWFKMTSDFKGELLPQHDEGISKVEWLSKFEIEEALNNTYENIKLLFSNNK